MLCIGAGMSPGTVRSAKPSIRVEAPADAGSENPAENRTGPKATAAKRNGSARRISGMEAAQPRHSASPVAAGVFGSKAAMRPISASSATRFGTPRWFEHRIRPRRDRVRRRPHVERVGPVEGP